LKHLQWLLDSQLSSFKSFLKTSFITQFHKILLNRKSEADVNLKVEKDLFFCDTYYYYTLLECDFNHCFLFLLFHPKDLIDEEKTCSKALFENYSIETDYCFQHQKNTEIIREGIFCFEEKFFSID